MRALKWESKIPTQLSLTRKWKLRLCNPVDYTDRGILLARILEWIAFPFSRGSSRPRDRTRVSRIAGRFFISWATREAQMELKHPKIPWSESENFSVVSDSLQLHGLYSPWNSPGQNTGVGSCSFLQEIFSTQGLNPGLPHCRQMLYQLSQKGSPQK